jgi:hypothetical protein
VWWAGSKAHDVYLGTRAFAASRPGEPLHWQDVDGLSGSLDAFKAWLTQAPPRQRLRVWLSGGLCRPFLLPQTAGVQGEAEWQRVAGAMAPAHTGLNQPCAVWLSKGKHVAGARVAVAVEQPLLQQLQELVPTAGRHRLLSIAPWWSEVLRVAVKRDAALPALAVQDCDALTVLAGADSGFTAATVLTPIADAQAARAALTRWSLTADVDSERTVQARLVREQNASAQHAGAFGAWTDWSR